MDKSFQPIETEYPIRQGDVIRMSDEWCRAYPDRPRCGVILTADCDIAQGKIGDRYTYVALVTADEYLTFVWSAEELRRLSERLGDAASAAIYEHDRKKHPRIAPLSRSELRSWLRQDGVESVLNSLRPNDPQSMARLKNALELYDLACGESISTPLSRLWRIWEITKKKDSERKAQLLQALSPGQMRMDCFSIATMPGETNTGYVALLRLIDSIRPELVFKDQLAMRLSVTAPGVYRIGRLNDAMRFLLSQRFALLFSRIALPPAVEEECLTAAAMVVEQKTLSLGTRNGI